MVDEAALFQVLVTSNYPHDPGKIATSASLFTSRAGSSCSRALLWSIPYCVPCRYRAPWSATKVRTAMAEIINAVMYNARGEYLDLRWRIGRGVENVDIVDT